MYLQLGMVSSAQHTALRARPGIEKEKAWFRISSSTRQYLAKHCLELRKVIGTCARLNSLMPGIPPDRVPFIAAWKKKRSKDASIHQLIPWFCLIFLLEQGWQRKMALQRTQGGPRRDTSDWMCQSERWCNQLEVRESTSAKAHYIIIITIIPQILWLLRWHTSKVVEDDIPVCKVERLRLDRCSNDRIDIISTSWREGYPYW